MFSTGGLSCHCLKNARLKQLKTGFNDRLAAAAEAKKARLAKFQPKPAAIDPDFESRETIRQAEIEAVRAARAAEREAKKQARLDAEEARRAEEAKSKEAIDAARRASQHAELMKMYGRKRR